ncbi:MAG TPA: hypothetical protein VE999_01200 [Gemmataceae bacterium]|nr:hypothetical protein [Gemmataceae bacterium]
MKNKRRIEERLESYKLFFDRFRYSSSLTADIDGKWRTWPDLTAEGKLDFMLVNAAASGIPFEPLAEVMRDAMGDLPQAVREEAALRVALRYQQELHELWKLLPREQEPASLIEGFKQVLGKQSLAALKAEGQGKQPGRQPSRSKGIER